VAWQSTAGTRPAGRIVLFLSEDPLTLWRGRESEITQYAYVISDPVNLVDPSGQSWVHFKRNGDTVTVYDSHGNQTYQCTACNITTNPTGNPHTPNSNGPAPPGVYRVRPPRFNTGKRFGYIPSEGPCFIPIEIPDRPGIGMHGGRRGPSSPTQGCIRLPNGCLIRMVTTTQGDPIIGITID